MLHSARSNTVARRLSTDYNPDWRNAADCRDHDPEKWFPLEETFVGEPPSKEELAALTICRTCPARASCLAWALGAGEVRFGVLGGLKAAARAALRRAGREVAA